MTLADVVVLFVVGIPALGLLCLYLMENRHE